MSNRPLKTRFAPSPTGLIHLGNARTALFSWLLARKEHGRFVLRIEDTDQERSRDEFVSTLESDLRWLGLEWQEGPGTEEQGGPWFQSLRGDIYERYYGSLLEQGLAYRCFCTSAELELSRKAQRSAGRPPRYSGKCAGVAPEVADERAAAGEPYTLRFRVPAGTEVGYDDLVRGPQRFRTDDIGDFIIRRADGSPAFFFSNAVDDSLMGVTHVLRGEDHLTNTPRQLLLLDALGLDKPQYGHIALIVGADGSPLSKRHGSRSLQALCESGFLPEAVNNYLARLGHTYECDALMSLGELAAAFALERLGRAPARFDEQQLNYWQQQAVAAASADRLWDWMGPEVHALVPAQQREVFLEAVRPNCSFPQQALRWARVIFTDEVETGAEADNVIREAGASFFAAAAEASREHPEDFKALAAAVKERTGAKGRGLFMPLRAALTGETGGPEMGDLYRLIGPARAQRRLDAAAG